DTTLTEALRTRHTSRDLTGSLSAQQLSSLLWTAQSPTGSHHPYPSAGARYCARIRLVALNVTGLTPGIYEADERARVLYQIAPVPSIEDLEATSMWFGPTTTPLAGTPAVLAVYVQLGALRHTYGLRALPFAYAEAGHL